MRASALSLPGGDRVLPSACGSARVDATVLRGHCFVSCSRRGSLACFVHKQAVNVLSLLLNAHACRTNLMDGPFVREYISGTTSCAVCSGPLGGRASGAEPFAPSNLILPRPSPLPCPFPPPFIFLILQPLPDACLCYVHVVQIC